MLSFLLGELLAANSYLSPKEVGSPVPVHWLNSVTKTSDSFHLFPFLACWLFVFMLFASWLQYGCHSPRHLISLQGLKQERSSKAKTLSFEGPAFLFRTSPSTADFPLPSRGLEIGHKSSP